MVAVVLALAFLGAAGPVGRGVAEGLAIFFGMWAWFIPLLVAGIGVAMVGTMPRTDYARLTVGSATIFVASLGLLHLMSGALPLSAGIPAVMELGGAVGSLIAFPLQRLIGFWGAWVVLFSAVAIGALIATRATVRDVGHALQDTFRWVRHHVGLPAGTPPVTVRNLPAAPTPATQVQSHPAAAKPEATTTTPKKAKPRQPPPPMARPRRVDGYQLPPGHLLHRSASAGHNRRALEQAGAELQDALHQHGVDARLVRIVPGPTVTRFEIELSPGVKVSRITGMASDIAYAMASADVRILAPIPGKSAIGIEVPNRHRELVTLGDLLSSPVADDPDPMKVGLGKDISGATRMLKLDELPHLLIAGATGAGKSSCINALVTSLLMRATPDDVRMILVDPKRVELGQYNGVPHLLTKVITNPKRAAEALQWAVAEMDRRYSLLAEAGVRDISSYRETWDAGGLDEDGFDRFPYIVVIVDELNDLMMVAGRTVEDSVVRIAQMARAVGIHLVLATQRPSVNVITGVIKANVPSRLAFSVASQTDSRVILDSSGAEKLVGLGDMLMVTARDPKPERVQGAFVSEAEVRAVVDWTKTQERAEYRDADVFEATAAAAAAGGEDLEGEDAEVIQQAIELIVRSQLGSTSMLQRKLRIGFARAGRVMDILENKGIVGPSEGSKARAVLVTEEELRSVLQDI
ncbi:MAG: DNA translocase FtsK 4TM domain-containing protein [Acidimicrobiia bacterium]|nr:DNA translocase FtsK 4TM domain-containing protein [Acidimicrobiia bacterium]